MKQWNERLTSSLLVRPPKNELESGSGYLLRLADVNGLRRPAAIFALAAARMHGTAAACPHCLGEGLPWQSAWLDTEQPWCSRHGCWLVDRCAGCRKTFSWRHVRRWDCECGRPIASAGARDVRVDMASALAERAVTPETLLWLGAIERFGLADKPGKKAARQSIEDRSLLLDLGWSIVQDWPGRFLAVLERERRHVATGVASVFSEAFPTLTRRIRRIREPLWRDRVAACLREMTEASAQTDAPILYRKPRSAVVQAKTDRVRAQRRLRKLSEHLAAAGQAIPTRVTKAGRSRRVLSTALQAVSFEEQPSEAARQLARVLEISRGRARELKGRDTVWAQELRAQILDRASKSVAHDPGPVIEWSAALRFHVPRLLTQEFLQAVATGMVSLCGPVTNLGRLRIQRESLAAWMRGQPRFAAEHCSFTPSANGEVANSSERQV